MKSILFFASAIFVSLSSNATMCFDKCAPACVNLEDGTYAWSLGGQVIQGNCKGYVAKCDQIGTENEGWYRHAKIIHPLTYSRCSESTDEPICVNVGTSSEGWSIPDSTTIVPAKCADQMAICVGRETRSEGWAVMTIDPEPNGIILKQKCSR